MSASPGRLADRIFDPLSTAPGRRCALLLEALRAWGEPLSTREIGELLDWRPWAVKQALDLLAAEGRVGYAGPAGWIADPPLAPTLCAH